MEKLGDSIINELETAEDAVCKAWGKYRQQRTMSLLRTPSNLHFRVAFTEAYYDKTLDFAASSSEAIQERLAGAHEDGAIALDVNTAVPGCADLWLEEMRYRMAVAFLSSVWEKCSSELSKLFLSMKDAECSRRSRLRDLMIDTARRQEALWSALPAAIGPVLEEFVAWPMERKVVEDDVQWSIRERAQTLQLEEAERKKPGGDDAAQPRAASGLEGADDGDGNFELSSPLVSDLLCKAKVLEKRSPGMMSAWKVSVAVVTSDSFLQLFELPSSCKLHSGSAPEVAFQNLIPPVVVRPPAPPRPPRRRCFSRRARLAHALSVLPSSPPAPDLAGAQHGGRQGGRQVSLREVLVRSPGAVGIFRPAELHRVAEGRGEVSELVRNRGDEIRGRGVQDVYQNPEQEDAVSSDYPRGGNRLCE